MDSFTTYFELGLRHIADIRGYDHILFIIALCATYTFQQLKEVAILVTAFTVGHSVTLALAALNIIPVNESLIELLIPITILLTSLYNISRSPDKGFTKLKYGLAIGFGLIHGMGFSNYFRVILGKEASITGPLFAFNIGLEAGQLLIVVAFLLLESMIFLFTKMKKEKWIIFASGATAGISIILIIEMLIG